VWLGAVVLLAVASRLLLVVTALLVGSGAFRQTVALGVASAIVFVFSKAAQAHARVIVQRDLYARTLRAVLEGDVLAVPSDDVRRVVLEGTYHGVTLVAQVVPVWLADLVTSITVAPLLVRALPVRVLVLAALALVVVSLVALALRVFAHRLERRSAAAYAEVFDALLVGIEARTEIVARGGEADFAAAFDRQLSHYEVLARRAGAGSALLGRMPLVAGALAVALVVALDGASRSALEGAVVAQALLLAACFPAIHGAAVGAHASVRSVSFVLPLVELLRSPRRMPPAQSEVVRLPAPVRAKDVSFAYDDASPAVLSDIGFDWPVHEPLVVTGPNGAGKSTLFKLLLGLRPTRSGSIRYGAHDLTSLDLRALRREVAYLPQRPYLGESHAAVRAAMRLVTPRASDEEMRTALRRVGVLAALHEHGADELGTPIGELSTGQRQRVALARVLLQDARIVLLDEPDANLDRDGIVLVAALVQELSASGKMVAVAAHTRELAELSPRVVHLGEGHRAAQE
jgi:ABC-type multidrug transport system fused ATPase/permease subunit